MIILESGLVDWVLAQDSALILTTRLVFSQISAWHYSQQKLVSQALVKQFPGNYILILLEFEEVCNL